MIKAISWDMGRVLRARHLEDKSWHRKWETYLDLVPGQLEEIVFSSHQATRGEITPAEVWQDVRARLSVRWSYCA